MSVRELTSATFAATVAGNPVVVVVFQNRGCAPCRRFAPVFARAGATHPDLVFASVDTASQRPLAGAAGVTALPTVMAFRDGLLVHARPGAVDAAELDRLVAMLRDLDIPAVRERVLRRLRAAGA
jgi:thioredoxin-like negative regulator of GroEL